MVNAGWRLRRALQRLVVQPGAQRRGRHRAGEQEALRHGAAQRLQNLRLPLVFHAFGDHGQAQVAAQLDDHPITVTPDTEVNEVRRIMLEKHARYLPVMNAKTLLGVISFYDVARAVLEAQSFENQMLKAYIRDWPAETTD